MSWNLPGTKKNRKLPLSWISSSGFYIFAHMINYLLKRCATPTLNSQQGRGGGLRDGIATLGDLFTSSGSFTICNFFAKDFSNASVAEPAGGTGSAPVDMGDSTNLV